MIRSAAALLVLAAACDRPPEAASAGASPGPGVQERPGAEPEGAHGHTGEGRLGASAAAPGPIFNEIRALLDRQSTSWNGGNLEAFVSVYSTDARFMAPSGTVVGRDAILGRYRERYGRDPGAMGALRIEVVDVQAAKDGSLATAALLWHLQLPGKEAASGPSLIVLRRGPSSRWEIVHDASM